MEKTDKSKEHRQNVLKNKRRVFILVVFIFMLLCMGVLLFFYLAPKEQTENWQWVSYLAGCLLPTFVSVFIIEFWFQKFIEKESREELEDTLEDICENLLIEREKCITKDLETICENLYEDEKTPLFSSLNKGKLKGIIQNALTVLTGKNIADEFVKSIIDRLVGKNSYRTNFKYNVKFKKDKEQGSQRIEQRLEYRKWIKQNEGQTLPQYIVVQFLFNDDPFQKAKDSNHIRFFCEELTSVTLINRIKKNKGNNNEIIKILDFQMYLTYQYKNNGSLHSSEVEIYDCQILFMPGDKGIEIIAPIDPKYWIKNDTNTASIKCRIKTNYETDQTSFYWKFPEPILGNTMKDMDEMGNDNEPISFTLSLPNGLIEDFKKDVKVLSYFSGGAQETLPEPYEEFRYNFSSKGIYFPESGIYFHW